MTIGWWPRHISPHIWAMYKQMIQRSSLPVLAGPFRGELGFEALYWIPFLKALDLDPDRLIPVTRGGAHHWYPAKRAVELYALREPRSVRVENIRQQQASGLLKQLAPTPWDRAVLREAAHVAGLTRYLVLHPAWMYRVLWPFWDTVGGLKWLQRHTTYTKLPAPPLPPDLKLPERYLTAKFYYRPTWPAGDLTHSLAPAILQHLAAKVPVVLLRGAHPADLTKAYDEHIDQPLPPMANVVDLAQMTTLTAANNLAVQSAVLARSQGFLGTYGGLAQLGLSLGVPTISLYTEWQQTCLAHRHLTDLLGMGFQVTTHVLKVADIPSLQQSFPLLQLLPAPKGGSSKVQERVDAQQPVPHAV